MPETGVVWSDNPGRRQQMRHEFNQLIETPEPFDSAYEQNEAGRIARVEQDGRVTEIRAYEFTLNTRIPDELRVVLLEFGLRAAKEGFHQAIGPFLIPDTRPPTQHGQSASENTSHLLRLYTFVERQQPSSTA